MHFIPKSCGRTIVILNMSAKSFSTINGEMLFNVMMTILHVLPNFAGERLL